MKTQLSLLGLTVAIGLGVDLSTSYEKERTLRTETKINLEMETTAFSMERDGQPVEGRGGGGDSEESRTVVQIDQYLAHDGNRPTHLKRKFEEIGGEMSTSFGDQTMDRTLECQLSGITLELKAGDEDEPEVTVAEGKVDDSELLDGHRLGVALDALLPEGAVESGASWDLDEEQIERALGIDLANVVFRPVENEDGGGFGRGGGGGGGGRGGRGFGRMGGGGFTSLEHVEWKGKAKVADLEDTYEGETCVRIALELEGEGEMPEPQFGRGRDRREGFSLGLSPSPRFGNTIEAKLEGSLWVSLSAHHPRALDLSGEVKIETSMERDNGEFQMSMSSTREGKCDIEIVVSEEK